MSVSLPTPAFDSSEEAVVAARMDQYRAQFAMRFVLYGMLGIAGGGLLSIGIRLARPQYPQFGWAAVLSGALVVVLLIDLALQRRGRSRSAIAIFLVGFMVIMGAGPLLIPALLLPTAVCLLLPVLLGFLFLEKAGAWTMAGSSLTLFVADMVLARTVARSWFPLLPDDLAVITEVALGSMAFVAIGMIVRGIVTNQTNSFRTAQRVELQLERKARDEQEQREQLEQAKREIEQRVAVEEARSGELQAVLRQTREAAAALGSAAAEILTATTQQARGAGEQSSAITQASTTIDQIQAIAGQTAERARGVAGLAQQAGEVTRSGQQAVADALAGMQDIKRKVDLIARNILELSERAQAIDMILTAVNDLAAQSNMLALNAAVEAARAGESGRGFAVVAGEVRNLAEQSKVATVQVREILTEIQRGVNTAVMTTEEGIKGSEAGMRLVARAGETIDHLAARVQDSAEASLQITTAAGQQLTGMEQLAMAMRDIQQATGRTVAGARQSERAAHDLNELAGRLREVVQSHKGLVAS